MIQIPAAAKTAIDCIVKDQEGGWKLTSNANDPDGGWTYAGVTSTEFNAWLSNVSEGGPEVDINHIKDAIENDLPQLEEDIYSIYYDKYCKAISFDKLPVDLQGPLLSAAINIGAEDAVKILQGCVSCKQDGNLGSVTLAAIEHWSLAQDDAGTYRPLLAAFLREWTRHYIQLVAGNAQAWHSYAIHLYAEAPAIPNTPTNSFADWVKTFRPAVFRAGDLEGWFNRVEYWRT